MNIFSLSLHEECRLGIRVLPTRQHTNTTNGCADRVDLLYGTIRPQLSFLRRWSQLVAMDEDFSVRGYESLGNVKMVRIFLREGQSLKTR